MAVYCFFETELIGFITSLIFSLKQVLSDLCWEMVQLYYSWWLMFANLSLILPELCVCVFVELGWGRMRIQVSRGQRRLQALHPWEGWRPSRCVGQSLLPPLHSPVPILWAQNISILPSKVFLKQVDYSIPQPPSLLQYQRQKTWHNRRTRN